MSSGTLFEPSTVRNSADCICLEATKVAVEILQLSSNGRSNIGANIQVLDGESNMAVNGQVLDYITRKAYEINPTHIRRSFSF